MAGIKILVSGTPNSGKTTLMQSLDDVFVIARDGKRYPFAQPHVNISQMVHKKNGPSVVDTLINTVNEKLGVYVEKFGKLPETIVWDSISKIFLDIEASVSMVVTSFPYSVINAEISKLVNYIENELIARDINVIIVSHANWDEATGVYKLVNAGGAYGKKGGFLSEVDNAIFVEAKKNKRVVHHRSLQFISRTLSPDLPDTEQVTDYNLKKHLEVLKHMSNNAAAFEL